MTGLQPAGLLHSEIRGSMSAYDSPRHIAVNCVLLRLPVPRHSPCALCSLTISLCDSLCLNLFGEIAIWFYPFAVSFKKFDFSLHITLCSVFKVQSSRAARRSQSRFGSLRSPFSFGEPAPLSAFTLLCDFTKPFLRFCAWMIL